MPGRMRYVQPPPAEFPYASTSTSPYPSPTYAVSPLSVSSGPVTTPPFNHTRSLYACAPLPALNGYIHPALDAHNTHLTYDVSYDPSCTPSTPPIFAPRVLAEAATTPSLPCVTVVSDCFPWRIAVYPSSRKAGAYVTVADVLHTIYRELHRQVRPEELQSAPPRVVDAARLAHFSRCNRLAQAGDPVAAQSEAYKGIRRIDFLQGRHKFSGLLSTAETPDVWQLSVAS
ncbi:hypothetical protein GGX14DRAFT_416098 [Mycena pura]|uniref:DUF6699 domain-containing protein n=1 Tax=Mycena pura TaxID=153505 RepID=A0AAD6YTQ9_9AGAR|nr:hypothetical protein GGX14DRAFT_416098 [Mycena pura]